MRTCSANKVLAATRLVRFAALMSFVSMTISLQFANAATIADFPFTGSSFASTDAGTAWDTSDLTTFPQSGDTGLPLTTSAGGTSTGLLGNPVPAAEVQYGDLENQTTANVTLADSIALNNYYSFTVSPLSGATLDFTELAYEFARTGGAAASAHVFSSIGGFTLGDEIDSFTSPALGILDAVSVDLTALADTTDPVEFRIYLTRLAASVMSNTIFLDNIQLSGNFSVPPIPEPSSALLLGMGALGLLRYTRRRSLRS